MKAPASPASNDCFSMSAFKRLCRLLNVSTHNSEGMEADLPLLEVVHGIVIRCQRSANPLNMQNELRMLDAVCVSVNDAIHQHRRQPISSMLIFAYGRQQIHCEVLHERDDVTYVSESEVIPFGRLVVSNYWQK